MCELAVITYNKGNDAAKGHRMGDVIAIMPNGHAWGAREDQRAHLAKYGNLDTWSGNFKIIQIIDLSVADAQQYLTPRLRPATIADVEFLAPDIEDRIVQAARKAWSININAMPAIYKNSLSSTGYTSLTRNQITAQFRNKETGQGING